jgi:hypothetical protein
MTHTESLAMLWRAHAQNVIRALEVIDRDLPFHAVDAEYQKRLLFEAACDEWKRLGWLNAHKFMLDNKNSKHDFSAETKPAAASVRLQEKIGAALARQERMAG